MIKHHKKRLFPDSVLRILVAAVVGLGLAVWLVLWQGDRDSQRVVDLKDAAKVSEAQVEDHHLTVPPRTKEIGGPISLTNQDGKLVTDADWQGKYRLIYFGYTSCPDMCPTGLSSIGHALDQLGPDASKVAAIYITVDPARDTAAKLKVYAAQFHPSIISLTGTDAQIATVAKEYQVYYAKGEGEEGDDYVVDHSSLIYLMDPNGKFITSYDEEIAPSVLVKAVKEQLAKPQ